ncbi:MAG: N-(5'-phosphoribosyl)anthranilate isomerase [Pseudomonadota bacterium]
MTPEETLDQLFSSKAARRGEVIRRAIPWVKREIGADLLRAEVARRGFQLYRTDTQIIVVCSSKPLRHLI